MSSRRRARERPLRPGSLHAVRRAADAQSDGFDLAETTGQAVGERADECVPGAGRVGRLDRGRRDPGTAPPRGSSAAPRAPRVTTTRDPGRRANAEISWSAGVARRTGQPANSSSLGTTQSAAAITAASMPAAGAGFRTVTAPAERAAVNAAAVIAWGISNWPPRASAGPPGRLGPHRRGHLVVRAGTQMIRFRPRVNRDRRDAARTGNAAHEPTIDPQRREVVHRLVAVHILAQRVDHRHLGAEPAGPTAWFAPLPPNPSGNRDPDRLAGGREGRVGDGVDHRAPDDGDPG